MAPPVALQFTPIEREVPSDSIAAAVKLTTPPGAIAGAPGDTPIRSTVGEATVTTAVSARVPERWRAITIQEPGVEPAWYRRLPEMVPPVELQTTEGLVVPPSVQSPVTSNCIV